MSMMYRITLPSTLKRIETGTFGSCERLRSVEIPHGVEYIGYLCFYESGIKEIRLSSTLKEMDENVFKAANLKTIWVEEGCTLDVRKYVGNSVKILLVNETRVWG